MSNRQTSDSEPKVVPVGIDLGSRRARVAVGSFTSSTASSIETAAAQQFSVASNTTGHRSTLAVATTEKNQEEPSSQRKQDATPHYVFGDAALRLLHRDKAPVVHVRDALFPSDPSSTSETAFLGHLGRLASDATAADLTQLRVAVSVPVDASEDYVEVLKEAVEQGIRAEMERKPKRKHSPVVVGAVADPAAVLLAHGLLLMNDVDSCSSSLKYSNVLVVDAGASGFTLSHLSACGTSRLWRVVQHERLAEVSGPAFVTLLAKHVCSQFERKHRVTEVWDSKKARFKLMQACELALPSLSSKRSSVHVTIDGLYEGMDCHIPVSPPRWDMLTAPLLRKAQALLEQKAKTIDELDAVLLAGCGSPLVQPLVDKVFAEKNVYGGEPTVPPEEAVALGCARHAAACLAHDLVSHRHSHQVHVPVSPVTIAIGSINEEENSNENAEFETVIGQNTPLPAHIVHKVTRPKPTLALWQLAPERKILAQLEGLPTDETLEVLIELTSHGKLSVALQGGATVTI